VNDDGIPVILDLVDQIHGLRRMLRELLSAIQAQPEAMKRWIIADLHGRASDQPGDAEDPALPRSPGRNQAR
jgi:hypothetical protein